MNFFSKSLRVLALSTIIISNVQSAGIVKLSKINNQSGKPFRFLFYRQVDVPTMFGTFSKDKSGQYGILPNSTEKIGIEFLNQTYTGQMFQLDEASEDQNRVFMQMKIAVENGNIILENHSPAITIQNLDKIMATEPVDLNYDYSINLIIKPDFTINMHVIQE